MISRKILRSLLRIPRPRITAAEALDIAKNECLRQGWKFARPQLFEGLRCWGVGTDGESFTGGWHIEIDQQTGVIVRVSAPPPR